MENSVRRLLLVTGPRLDHYYTTKFDAYSQQDRRLNQFLHWSLLTNSTNALHGWLYRHNILDKPEKHVAISDPQIYHLNFHMVNSVT